jgi:hypothetical protein
MRWCGWEHVFRTVRIDHKSDSQTARAQKILSAYIMAGDEATSTSRTWHKYFFIPCAQLTDAYPMFACTSNPAHNVGLMKANCEPTGECTIKSCQVKDWYICNIVTQKNWPGWAKGTWVLVITCPFHLLFPSKPQITQNAGKWQMPTPSGAGPHRLVSLLLIDSALEVKECKHWHKPATSQVCIFRFRETLDETRKQPLVSTYIQRLEVWHSTQGQSLPCANV